MKTIDINILSELVASHAREELERNQIGVKEVIVHQAGRRVYHGVFGAPEENREKRLLFRAASMTKPITAAVAAQLADRGLLDLNEPAYRYFPQMKDLQVATVKNGEIVSLRPVRNVIRVADLLCHTSGIGCSPVFELMSSNARLPQKESVGAILTHPLSFEPLTAQAYSPTDAFDIAAGVVTRVSGMAFDEYLQRNLFEPLGMVDTTFSPNSEQWGRMVPMHARTKEGKSETAPMPEGCVFGDYLPERMAAGAGIASTAEDYIRFAEMLCHGGVAEDGTRVLSEAAVRQVATDHVPPEVRMGSERWGLGVRVITGADYPHGLGVGCFGWSGAYGTHFWVDPENEISVVMMKNSLYDGGAGNRSACRLEEDVAASLR